MTEPAALLTRRGPIAVITLNRPHVLNAVNADLSAAVGAALTEVGADPELRVAVLTGAGRAFCAGADLTEIAAGRRVGDPAHPERGFAGLVRHPLDKPLVAAINGPALGGGTEIVLACDLAVMSADAVLGLPEPTRGIIAAAGGLLRLPAQVPAKIATELVLTGRRVDAAEAARLGLVNRVVPAERLLDEAVALAEEVAANAPLAVKASKRVLVRRAELGSDRADLPWEYVESQLAALRGSTDAVEGARAFLEKRPPRWTAT